MTLVNIRRYNLILPINAGSIVLVLQWLILLSFIRATNNKSRRVLNFLNSLFFVLSIFVSKVIKRVTTRAKKEFISYEDIAIIVCHHYYISRIWWIRWKGMFLRMHPAVINWFFTTEIVPKSAWPPASYTEPVTRPNIISHFCFRQKLVEISNPNCFPDAVISPWLVDSNS